MRLKEEARKEKREMNRSERLKDEILAKRVSYSKLVKETCKPVVSEKKKIEMEYLRRSLNNRGLPLNLRQTSLKDMNVTKADLDRAKAHSEESGSLIQDGSSDDSDEDESERHDGSYTSTDSEE